MMLAICMNNIRNVCCLFHCTELKKRNRKVLIGTQLNVTTYISLRLISKLGSLNRLSDIVEFGIHFTCKEWLLQNITQSCETHILEFTVLYTLLLVRSFISILNTLYRYEIASCDCSLKSIC